NGNYFRDVVFTPSNAIVLENENEGADDWKLDVFATDEIAGYASEVSVNRGGSIEFRVAVKDKGTQFTIDVYRLGWYGGRGARRMGTTMGPLTGGEMTAASRNDNTRLAEYDWARTTTLQIPREWTPGLYHAKITVAGTTKKTAIWFVVRDD